jgi:hemerythrin
MSLIIWIDKYSTGFKDIDAQHKKLVNLINSLFDAIGQKNRKTLLNQAFTELVNYAVYHFDLEEKLMIQYKYPDYANHKKEHLLFVEKVNKYLADFDKGDDKVLLKIINFLKDWLLQHIMGTDKQYIPTFQANKHS